MPEKETKIYSYTAIFKLLEEGAYDVIVPAIPEICTFGENIKEAREMAEDSIRCFLESVLELNEPIPADSEISLEKIVIKVSS
jgi:predicted RNase H-like HicB family nuclease